MNKIVTLFVLIVPAIWGQADLDKLVLKDGTTYYGEYSKIEGKKVYFKPQGAFAFQPVSVKSIQTLKLRGVKLSLLVVFVMLKLVPKTSGV